MKDDRIKAGKELTAVLMKMGYPEDFGRVIAAELRTEKAIRRMTGYLRQARPESPEEIADEMLAIIDDRDRWTRKKIAEYNNSRYNDLLLHGLNDDED